MDIFEKSRFVFFVESLLILISEFVFFFPDCELMLTFKNPRFILKPGGLLLLRSREGMPRAEGWWPLKKSVAFVGTPAVPLPFSFPQPLGSHVWYLQALLERNCTGLMSTRAQTLGSERPCPPGGRCPNLKVPRDLATAEGAGTRSSYRICRAQSKMQM